MFFKYFGVERIGFFDDLLVRFSQLSSLNDPFEVSGVVDSSDLLDHLLKQSRKKAKDAWNRLPISYRTDGRADDFRKVAEEEEEFIREISSGYKIGTQLKSFINHVAGVFCVTTDHDNLLMWSHYASNHRGFVIGMKSGHEFFKKKGPGLTFPIRKVTYSDSRGVSSRNMGREGALGPIIYEKSLPWAYEKEYRLVRSFRDFDPSTDLLKEPAIYMDLVALPADLIERIYIGAHANPDLKEKAIAALEKHGLTAEIIQLHVKEKTYGLREERLV